MLLITGEEPGFVPGNQAFLTFASSNTKDVLRFTYVYQRQQQPLCQALLHNQAPLFAQVSNKHMLCLQYTPTQMGNKVYRTVRTHYALVFDCTTTGGDTGEAEPGR